LPEGEGGREGRLHWSSGSGAQRDAINKPKAYSFREEWGKIKEKDGGEEETEEEVESFDGGVCASVPYGITAALIWTYQ